MQLSAPLMESERITTSPGAGMTTDNDTFSGAHLMPPEPATKQQDTSACASEFTFNGGNQTVRNSAQYLTAVPTALSESMKIQKSGDIQTRAMIEENLISEVETTFP